MIYRLNELENVQKFIIIFTMGSALDKRGMLKIIWNKIDDKIIETKSTKEAFAKETNVAVGIITRIKYRTANPTLDTLEKIAKGLDMTLGELCDPDHHES